MGKGKKCTEGRWIKRGNSLLPTADSESVTEIFATDFLPYPDVDFHEHTAGSSKRRNGCKLGMKVLFR
jgi:hypothetical protein